MRSSFALLCAEGQVCVAFGRDTEMPVLPAVREVVERDMGEEEKGIGRKMG